MVKQKKDPREEQIKDIDLEWLNRRKTQEKSRSDVYLNRRKALEKSRP